MNGIGSLGLDSTLRYFMHGGQSVVTGYWCPPRVIWTTPRCTKKLICKKYAHNLSLYRNYERATAVPLILLLYGLYILPTMLRYERALYYGTTTAVCIHTVMNVPHSQNSRCHVSRRFLELDLA